MQASAGDDTSKFRRFGYMLVADPDYVLARHPYTHTHSGGRGMSAGDGIDDMGGYSICMRESKKEGEVNIPMEASDGS